MSNYRPFTYLRIRFPVFKNGEFLYTYDAQAFPPLNIPLEEIEKLDGHDPYYQEQISNIMARAFSSDKGDVYTTNFDDVEIKIIYNPPNPFNTLEDILGVDTTTENINEVQNEI